MARERLHRWIALGGGAVVFGLIGVGLFLLFTNPGAFRMLIREDGVVEYLTVAILVTSAFVAFGRRRAVRLLDENRKGPSRLWLLIGVIFLFGALEEISYGQRIFSIPTPEFLRPPEDQKDWPDAWIFNRQNETTVHNLMIKGVNLNKTLFGKFLFAGVFLYAVVLPLLCRLRPGVRDWARRWGVPVARPHQIALLFVVALSTWPFRKIDVPVAPRIGELQELGATYVILLTLRN